MQPLTNDNTKGISVKKVVDLIQGDLFVRFEDAKLVEIYCKDGMVKMHDVVLKYFEYFTKYMEAGWKTEMVQLQCKMNTLNYFKQILYRQENKKALKNTDIADLIILFDFIRIPFIFIKYIFDKIIANFEEEAVLNILSSVLEHGVKLPKTFQNELTESFMKNGNFNKTYVEIMIKYQPDYVYDFIVKLSDLRTNKHMIYIDATGFKKGTDDEQAFIDNLPIYIAIPDKMRENIVSTAIINRLQGTYKSVPVVAITLNDDDSRIELYNWIKKYNTTHHLYSNIVSYF